MGKFTINVPKKMNWFDSDVIKDIHNRLAQGRTVVILHETPEIARKVSESLMKRIPTEDVYRVISMNRQDFERRKTTDRENWNSFHYYQISAERILNGHVSSYLPNNSH